MKRILLPVLLIPSLLFAQSQPQSQPPPNIRPPRPIPASGNSGPQALPENYQLTLALSDEKGQPVELSFVTASDQFQTSLGEQGVTFTGTLTPEDSDGVLVAYALSWQFVVKDGQSTQYKSSSTSGSVHLKMEKEVPILRVGDRIVRLSIKKFQGVVAK